jgi:acetyl-CoA synthetase
MSEQYITAKARDPYAKAAAVANLNDYDSAYRDSIADPTAYWAKAAEDISWYRRWDSVLDSSAAPFYKWYSGGQTNMVLNALDRHVEGGRKDQLALIWEGEPCDANGKPKEVRTFTYGQLQIEVNKFANALKGYGLKTGDVVAVYTGRCPEQAIAMLACAKLGIVHNVVYGGLSVEALQSRVEDSKAKLIVTADGCYLAGKVIELKHIADLAAARCPTVETMVVIRRTGHLDDQPLTPEGQTRQTAWWHNAVRDMSGECATVPLEAETPFFIIYTSGSTGRPKGVLHTLGGYMVDVYHALKNVLDFKSGDTLFCTSDAGWVVGHSIVLYGPLMHGITTIMYEGAPAIPNPGRWWRIIQDYKVTVFFTAPTGVRGLMRFGNSYPDAYDKTSMRIMACAGEPLNPEAWEWFNQVIGGGTTCIVDNWWQTETSRPMISNLPVLPFKPGSCNRPMPGVQIDVVDDEGNSVPAEAEGNLVIKNPWPGMLRTIYGDPERYVFQYWSRYAKQGWYLTGDAAKFDKDGYLWVIGRTDDVIKVSGYRLGTAEVESALVSHPAVAEAAVIGLPHNVRGNAIHAFVILKAGVESAANLPEELRNHVGKVMGPIAKPEAVNIVSALPKTRSGKIMRRVLKARALGEPEGDLSTME